MDESGRPGPGPEQTERSATPPGGFDPRSVPPPPYRPPWAYGYMGPSQWDPTPAKGAPSAQKRGFWRLLSSRAAGWAVAAVLGGVVLALSIALATTPGGTPTRAGTTSPPATGRTPGSGFSPGGFFSGGTFGTVKSVSGSTFTITTSTGQSDTVIEQSSTSYREGRSTASASSVVTGARVIVMGSKSGTKITADSVIVLQGGNGGQFGFPGG